MAPDGTATTLTTVSCPPDVLLDADRRLYASSCSGEVRRIDADGTSTTLVTIPTCDVNSNPRLALDTTTDSLLASDECSGYVLTDLGFGPFCAESSTTGVVYEHPGDGSAPSTVYTGCPSSLAVDPSDSSLLLDDNCSGTIERVSGGVATTVVTTGANGCAFGVRADGTDVIGSNLCSGAVTRYAADGTATPVSSASGAAGLFVVPPKEEQTITFDSTPPDPAYVKAPFQADASSDSGLAVTYSADPTSTACTVSASGSVRFTTSGTCVIDADQAGDATHLPASASQTIHVVRRPQTITFSSTPPAHAVVGGSYPATADGGGSNQPVRFYAGPNEASVCTVAADGTVDFVGRGRCRIFAAQSGGNAYRPAPTVHQDVFVYRR